MSEKTKASKSRVHRGQSGKSTEERLQFSVGHRTRVYVLTLLNEGIYTPEQIGEIIGEPTSNVAHHISELLDANSIELADVERVRNVTRHYYRAVKMPYYSDEEMAAMTPEERQGIIGLTLQCMMAEILAAFWSGKMEADPRLWLAWRWFNVDEQGREELAEEQARSWQRIQEIEAKATNRRARSGEEAKPIIICQAGFPRDRTAPQPPPHSNFSS